MKIDLSQIDDFDEYRSVPPGEYHCRAVEVRESDSPAGHTRWGIRWEVIAGEYQGRTACWDSLHWSERGLPRVKFVLQMMGLRSEGELDLQTDDVAGRSAMVEVIHEEREDPVSGIRRIMNRVPFAGYSMAPVEVASER